MRIRVKNQVQQRPGPLKKGYHYKSSMHMNTMLFSRIILESCAIYFFLNPILLMDNVRVHTCAAVFWDPVISSESACKSDISAEFGSEPNYN